MLQNFSPNAGNFFPQVFIFIKIISLIPFFPVYLSLDQPPTILIFYSGSFIFLKNQLQLKIGGNYFICRKCILIFHILIDICMWFITLDFFCPQNSRRKRTIFKVVLLCRKHKLLKHIFSMVLAFHYGLVPARDVHFSIILLYVSKRIPTF